MFTRIRIGAVLGFLTFATVCFVLWIQLPGWAADALEARAPGLSNVGRVEIGWFQIRFSRIDVDRGSIQGCLQDVEVDLDGDFRPKAVRIGGGKLDVNLRGDVQSERGSGHPMRSLVESVYLDEVRVSHEDIEGVIEHVTYADGRLCFQSGSATSRPLPILQGIPRISLKNGCYDPAAGKVSVDDVTVLGTLSRPFPLVQQSLQASIQDVGFFIPERYVAASAIEVHDGSGSGIHASTVRIKVHGEKLYLDAAKAGVDHPMIAESSVHFNQVDVSLSLSRSTAVINLGPAAIRVDAEKWRIEGDESCTEWVQALPVPRSEFFDRSAFDGRLGFVAELKPSARVEFRQSCSVDCSDPAIARLKGRFTYRPYHADGETRFDRQSGRGTVDWVPLMTLRPNVPEAFIVMEDPAFPTHGGILTASLEVALQRNLEAEGPLLGGSTITQQLAKNLFLARDRTLVRKAEEALLAIALEDCLSKEQILELYLNVVEYAPEVYGIGPAAQYYFHKPASALSVDEAYYLAALLPHPSRTVPPNEGGLEQARKVMAALARNGHISTTLIPADVEGLDLSGWETTD